MALDHSERMSQEKLSQMKGNTDRQFVTCLREICRMCENGDPLPVLLKTAMVNVEAIVNADRLMLFLHDQEKDTLKTIVATVLRNEQKALPVGRGILGLTFVESKGYNLADAFSDYRFDTSFDLQMGSRTCSLVSIPLINHRKETREVADGKPFSNADIGYIQRIVLVCGLILENVKMHEVATKATLQFDKLHHSCDQIANGDQLKTVLTELVDDARVAIDADRSSLFILGDVLSVLSTDVSRKVSVNSQKLSIGNRNGHFQPPRRAQL
jgi:adenylate cyclase